MVAKVDLMSDLAVSVFRLNGVLIAWGDLFAAPEGLSSARWQMLGAVALAERPPTTPRIAAGMGMTRQGAQKQLNSLVEAGLMAVRTNPMHKRSPFYLLTERGQAAYTVLDERWRNDAVRATAAFTKVELETACKVLGRLVELYSPANREADHET